MSAKAIKIQDKIPKQRSCKVCKAKYTPSRPLQMLCSIQCSYKYVEILNQKKARKEKQEGYEKLKTHSDYVQELQKVFNEFIRERDKGLPCISCGATTGKINACHYRSAGGNPELRFNEMNCHSGCERCNTHLSGNLIDYRIGLIKKIGVANVEWLEGKHEPQKLSIPQLIEMKVKYRDKIKQLKNLNK